MCFDGFCVEEILMRVCLLFLNFREVKGLEEVMRIVKGWKVTEGVVRFRREEKVEEFNIVSREVGESKCKKLRPFSVFLTL